MPQIGWFEILIIVGIAIIVIGPKDFPIMLKKIGSWIGSAKRYVNQIQQEVTINVDSENEKEEKKKREQVCVSMLFKVSMSICPRQQISPISNSNYY